jgi:hypothetical protein
VTLEITGSRETLDTNPRGALSSQQYFIIPAAFVLSYKQTSVKL